MTRSKIAEMVEDEAARAESEDPDEDEGEGSTEGDPDEDEAEDEAESELSPEEPAEPLSMEAMQAALEREAVRHAETLAGIFGETFTAYAECPMCFMLGFVAPDSPVLDPTTQRCGRCKGYGFLMTESHAGDNATRQCPDCMGNGYVPRAEAPLPEAAVQPVVVPPMPVYNVVTNQWEVPNGNVNPAAPPAYVPPLPTP